MSNINIIFNGVPIEIDDREYSYNDLIYMKYENSPVKPMVYPDVMTITYDKGPNENREGSLSKGQKLKVTEGMIINAMRTDNS